MDQEDEEVFYDSLDEDCPPDLTQSLPLYSGETPKNQVASRKKKPEKHHQKPITYRNITKKSYLSMYYDKIKLLEGKTEGDGSATTRAVCENLSPRRDADLDVDLKTIPSQTHSDPESDQEEFYQKFLAAEIDKSSVSMPEDDKSSVQSKRSGAAERPFYFAACTGDNTDKLELLKKRQNYGTKMSMKNRIKLEETKSLKKIKNYQQQK